MFDRLMAAKFHELHIIHLPVKESPVKNGSWFHSMMYQMWDQLVKTYPNCSPQIKAW